MSLSSTAWLVFSALFPPAVGFANHGEMLRFSGTRVIDYPQHTTERPVVAECGKHEESFLTCPVHLRFMSLSLTSSPPLGTHFCILKHKVIIVGLDNAGKTTILYQFSMNEVVHTSPTIGSNVEEIVINNTRFLMWDIGGQESLRSSWNTYYTNTEFVIVVVDSTDRERISVTREELYKMLAHEDLRKAGLLIFANKQDVKECMTVAEISQFLKLTSIKDHQWHIQACCALTGEGLCQGLEWMMSRLKIR
ncbi:ADP-ribosylation factor-like protein 5A [Pteropus alecto]|uniref:ADP-ribosylation factor-like protein 5A n=1 Tax=Pteropus alecto TaxID=9402 RepID=L5K1H6_PTEAL|nr:ADP-ribosylation factor-like protein 5A [Pteropus alecto]